jgi:citrate synthase
MNTTEKPAYSPGLAGVIAGESAICWVDPNAGLLYRGYDVHELAGRTTFEDVAWLLLRGEMPSQKEAAEFARQLAAERALPAPVVEMLRLLPANTHPMDMLRTGVSMLGAFDPELNDHSHEANLRKATRLIAKVSMLIADGWRINHGQQPIPAEKEQSHAAGFLHALTGKAPEPQEVEIFDTVLVLYADHEFNASTFSARVTASTLSDM